MLQMFFAILIVLAHGAVAADSRTVTWTGWFSDHDCAAPRVSRGEIGPNGAACVKKCLERGIAPVFVSEQARTMFTVQGYANVKDDVGYYVELTGTVGEGASTITVASVKRLSDVESMCALPKKNGK